MTATTPIEVRFWRRVQKREPQDCWHWTGVTNNTGYGQIGRGGRNGGMALAHRVAYAIANGGVPADLCVLHTCDNPICVNPAHLRLGTHDENMKDMAAKGRSHYRAKDHCPKGHPYTEMGPEGRRCRTCMREAWRKYVAKKRLTTPRNLKAEYARKRERATSAADA